jgi:ethanolamine utilization protein EutQ
MSVGFARYGKKGERNEWIVTYDEILVVTKGAFTVRSAGEAKTAKAGELIFLTKARRLSCSPFERGLS